MRFGRFAAALGVSCFCARAVWADPVPSLDLRGFHPSTDPAASLYLEPTATPGHLKWNVGAWASYAHRLVTVTDANGKAHGVVSLTDVLRAIASETQSDSSLQQS